MRSGFDLNLFVVLQTLLEERSVTRTGVRLGRTQSAVSNSLKRLREAFADPLFVRTPSGLSPTPRAVELGKATAQIIRLTEQCLRPETDLDPTRTEARFVIGAPDRLSLPVLLPFLETLRRTAPGIRIDLRTTDRDYAIQLIEAREVDVALGWFDRVPPQINRQLAFSEALVCLCRPGHPIVAAGGQADLPTILSYPHLVVSSGGDRRAAFDAILARNGLHRTAATSLTNFTMVPDLLRDSDLVGVFTKRTADYFAAHHRLATHPLPLEVEPIAHHLIWHRRLDADKQHHWLREQILAACTGGDSLPQVRRRPKPEG